MIPVTTAAELAEFAPGPDHPQPDDVADLRAWLDDTLDDALAGWDRPIALLGITKGRVRAAAGCPGSIVGEAVPRSIEDATFIGTIVDAAASLLLVSDKVPGQAPWLGALMQVLDVTEPEIADHVAGLGIAERDRLRMLVQERCELLRDLLGDLRACEGTTQERFRAVLHRPGVVLSGRTDLVLGRRHRSIVEVKSGVARGDHVEELAFYALLAALRDGVAPTAVAVVALGSARIDAHAVTLDMLEGAAHRVISTAGVLAEVDTAVSEGRWPRTEPGPFCSWCSAAPFCPDVPDIALAEQEARRDRRRAGAGAGRVLDDDGGGGDPFLDDDPEDEPW